MVFQEPPKKAATSCMANCSDENTLRPIRSDAAATGRWDRIIMTVPSATRTTRTTPARWLDTKELTARRLPFASTAGQLR